MLALHSSISNEPVVSLQNGAKLGVITTPIIDPRKLQIVAYRVSGPRIFADSVIFCSDIREYGPLGFIVDGADRIMELDESLVRLKEIIKFNFSLPGKLVIDEHKRKLGKVVDYAIELESFLIQKIHVSQSILKNLNATNLIISRTQIVELTDTTIVVRSGALKQGTGLLQAVNPFRRSTTLSPTPEQSSLKKQSL